MGWNQFNFAPPNGLGVSGIAAVSRIPNSMEVWWIESDGSVQGAYFYDGSAWGRYQLAAPGSASFCNGITAVSRRSDTMEVFWIGKDGSVQNAHWYDGSTWQYFTLSPAGSAAPFSNIKVVSRIPTSMEVWWVGPQGSIQDAYFYDGGAWQQFALAPAGSANAYSGIAAVARVSDAMDVFWTAPDGSVRNAEWNNQGWKLSQLAGAGSADPMSGMEVVSRIPTSMELWWIGSDGSVQDCYWYEGSNWVQFALAPAGSARTGGNIRAVSRIPTSMEVWWTAKDGSLQDSYWYDAGNWAQFALAAAGSLSVNAGLAAVSRTPNSMELWWTAQDGSISDGNWYADKASVTKSAQVLTPAGTALGGTVDFTISSDGTFTSKFHMHDSGFPNYDFQVRAIWVAQSGMTFVAAHSGNVQGTVAGLPFGTPNRNDDDTETGASPFILQNWADVSTGRLWVTKDYSTTGVVGFIEDVAKAVLDIGAGVIGGTLGVVIGLGEEAGKLFGSLGIGETFGVIAGVVVFVATGSVALAIIDGIAVGAVTNALIKQRPLTAAEITFAEQVFQGSINFSQVVLTNLSGIGGRAFTFPGVDGKQYINITSGAYNSPLTYTSPAYSVAGQLLIHELTHAWQIQHNSFLPGIVCQGIVNQTNYTVGDDVYDYGAAGQQWSAYNLESQGAIVDEWFAGDLTAFVPIRKAMDPGDPYFMYIANNIRAGKT